MSGIRNVRCAMCGQVVTEYEDGRITGERRNDGLSGEACRKNNDGVHIID